MDLERVVAGHAKKRPAALLVPALASEMDGPAWPIIMAELQGDLTKGKRGWWYNMESNLPWLYQKKAELHAKRGDISMSAYYDEKVYHLIHHYGIKHLHDFDNIDDYHNYAESEGQIKDAAWVTQG